MSKIVIIGNSPASLAAIESLRQHGFSGEIVLFCAQTVLPYQGDSLASWVAKDIKESQVFIKLDKFADEHKVSVISTEKLIRVSTKRHQLTTENKTHVPFDQILITDLPMVSYPPIKGSQKEGVFNPYQFLSVKSLTKNLHEIDNVAISVNSLEGFDFACALSRQGKEVVLYVPKEGLLNSIFDEETSMLLKQIIEAKGMRVIYDDIEEILGDAQVKAVRLSSGKVMAAQAVIMDQVTPDLKLLNETDILSDGGLKISSSYQTAAADVFACGNPVMGFGLSSEELSAHARAAAMNMINQNFNVEFPGMITRKFGSKICDGFYCGQIKLPENGREHMKFDGPLNVYKKIYLSSDRLIGAVWMNALDDLDRVTEAVRKKTELQAGLEEQFL